MTPFDLVQKMALTIKHAIDAHDNTQSAMVGHLEWEKGETCILPKQLRRDLGECLDDLKNMHYEKDY